LRWIKNVAPGRQPHRSASSPPDQNSAAAAGAAAAGAVGAAAEMRRPPRVPAISIWYRIPLALRVLVLFTAWFSYGVLLSNLNSLDYSTRTAEIIWGACQAGTWVTAVADAAVRGSFDSLDELITYSTALRTGDPPPMISIPGSGGAGFGAAASPSR
jgi:hypothetical protein